MENEIKAEKISIEELREQGLSLWKEGINKNNTELKKLGAKYLLDAYKVGDIEAAAWVGFNMYSGLLKPSDGNPRDVAIRILYNAANKGNLTARLYLNRFCAKQYEELIESRQQNENVRGPLVDFDGKPIKINKTGMAYPVDAVLEYKDGTNKLILSLNLFFGDDELDNQVAFENAVIKGIKEWEGKYQVFGGQSLFVEINVTVENRLFDNVLIIPLTETISDTMQKFAKTINTNQSRKNIDLMINQKRSGAVGGILKKWSAKSRKIICIVSENGKFDDYEEIKHVAKHEFGHVLGLGDLYESKSDLLEGVEEGKYEELDGYYVDDRCYNLVMCDHHGPVSNNDIEMVVLAFCENKMQLYQKDIRFNKEISKALGRGN